MLTSFEAWKLARFKTRFGVMTAEEALLIALDAEDIKLALRPGDLAQIKFAQDQEAFFEYAQLLEKE